MTTAADATAHHVRHVVVTVTAAMTGGTIDVTAVMTEEMIDGMRGVTIEEMTVGVINNCRDCICSPYFKGFTDTSLVALKKTAYSTGRNIIN